MRYAGKDGKVISSRYRDCQRDLKSGTLCQAKIERQMAEGEWKCVECTNSDSDEHIILTI